VDQKLWATPLLQLAHPPQPAHVFKASWHAAVTVSAVVVLPLSLQLLHHHIDPPLPSLEEKQELLRKVK
jgi:hypothetical protein